MTKRTFAWCGLFLFAAALAFAQGPPAKVIVIKGARIVPVVGDDIPSGTIVIKDGLIDAIGAEVPVPPGARVIDAAGLIAYPGLVDGYSFLGLSEISGVSATVDSRESGRINPQVRSIEALRYDSMHIPISRSNGITAALVAPSGGLISGMSCLVHLDGWTNREMVIRTPAALHIELATIRGGRGGFMGMASQQRVETPRALEELKALFAAARAYEKRKACAARQTLLALPDFDETAEALLPVLRGDVPVMFSVHSGADIKLVISFVQAENLRAIFFGVEQGYRVAADIQKAAIPCIMGSLYDMPPTWEDGYDAIFRNPGELAKAGVKIAFASVSSSTAKDLPYHAAKAAAFGLDRREALKAVTLYPAQIFGVDKALGSLEKGKAASIVLADNDILEFRTNIKHVFINGREADLSNRYTELLEKFKKRDTEEK